MKLIGYIHSEKEMDAHNENLYIYLPKKKIIY